MDTSATREIGSGRRRGREAPVAGAGPRVNAEVEAAGPPATDRSAVDRVRALVAVTALLAVAWVVAALAVPDVRFVVVAPKAKTGYEVFVSLLQLFTALVLVLFPTAEERDRLSWVALGFLLLGLGGFGFGYAAPLLESGDDLNLAMYGSLLTRSAAALALAVGLVSVRPPRLSRAIAAVGLAGVVASSMAIALGADRLPMLVELVDIEEAAHGSNRTLPGLTGWHWTLSLLPLGLASLAAVGAVRRLTHRSLGAWLAVALALMAGSQLHTLFWPSAFSPIVTTASLQRFGYTVVVAVGAFFALRRVATEQTALLATEREATARLADLARLRADFTAMVAHELASPVAAIRGYAAMLTTGDADGATTVEAGAAIRAEADLLTTLVGDIRTAASIERDDFALYPFPVRLDLILADAVAYARALPGDHPIECALGVGDRVVADPERIAQVLRNLLDNAAKYAPSGTSIALRATRAGERVRIEVIDRGPGIDPADAARIFEKFGRGRPPAGERAPGLGLGLYLCRRIVRAHGSELRVESTLGAGATFWFELAVAR